MPCDTTGYANGTLRSYLAHLGQEEERRDQRRSVAVAVDYLMWLVGSLSCPCGPLGFLGGLRVISYKMWSTDLCIIHIYYTYIWYIQMCVCDVCVLYFFDGDVLMIWWWCAGWLARFDGHSMFIWCFVWWFISDWSEVRLFRLMSCRKLFGQCQPQINKP